MISDELRELLSAYVDGELPHADAARVEDSAKRDPRLRRQILAYRRLRDTLQVWDAEENSLEPSGRVRLRALARVQALQAQRVAEKRARRDVWFKQPWALAAGVLIAVTAGVLASMTDGNDEVVRIAVRSEPLPISPLEPFPDYAAPFEAKPLPGFAGVSVPWVEGAIEDVIRNQTEGVLVEQDGEFFRWSRRKLAADHFIRNLDRLSDGRRIDFHESKTGVQPNRLVASWLKDAETGRTPYGGIVTLRLAGTAGAVPDTRAVPARTDKASRYVQAGELKDLHDVRVTAGLPVLTLAGELWVEPVGDGKAEEFRRARVVTATTWIKRGELVPMAWANATAADPSAHKQWALRAEAFVLGPRARRVLLNKSGKDEALLTWIAATYGAQGVVNAARADMRKHKGVLASMVRALSRDAKATGFAVYDASSRLLGTELFATHKLMVQFAPRLLAGYLLEAGDRIRLDRKGGGAADVAGIEKLARRFLSDELPRQVRDVVPVRTEQGADDWPKGMRQVNLQTPTRQIVGHGLLVGDRPMHLTLFAE